MSKTKLNPCPFCGSDRLSDECTGAAEINGHTYQTGWIECLDCGCDGPSVDLTDETPAQNDYQLVRDAWNHRAAPTMPPADWSVFNDSACVADGLTYAEALDYLTPERLQRGWSAVCVANRDNIVAAAPDAQEGEP